MKQLRGILTLLSLSFISCQASSQSWKDYSDSAKANEGQNNRQKAIEFYQQALGELKKDSTGTATYAQVSYNLGIDYAGSGEPLRAQKLFQESKTIREKILGKESADYAASCNALGITYRDQRVYALAEQLLTEGKNIREKVIGKETRDYGASCYNLALLYSDKGDTQQARALFTEASQIFEKVLGKNSQLYIANCYALGNTYEIAKEFEKAETYSLEVKQIKEQAVGRFHLEYLDACNRLAHFYRRVAFYPKAEEQYLEMLEIWEKLYGKEDLDYSATAGNLATVYNYMGEYENAEKWAVLSRDIDGRLSGKDDPEYAGSSFNLGVIYINKGEYEKARQTLLEARQTWEKHFGKEGRYAMVTNSLANIYSSLGQYDKAEQAYIEANQIQIEIFGKEDPEYASSLANLAVLYEQTGQYEKAEPLSIEAKKIWEKAVGKNHPHYAVSCDDLGYLYVNIGQYEKALKLFLEAKQIREKTIGKQHPDYAASCRNVGLGYRALKQFDTAIALYSEAKSIFEHAFGKEDDRYAAACFDLASTYYYQDDLKKAEPLFIESLQIRERVLGKQHAEYALTCFSLGSLYASLEQYDKAEPLLLEAKEVYEKAVGKQNPDYGQTCSNLARLYWSMHKNAEAEAEFKEAFSVNAYNLHSVFQFTNEKEKAAFVKNVLGEDDNAYSFYTTEKLNSGNPYSLSLFHRNLILSSSRDLREQLVHSRDTSLINKYNDWISLKQELAVIYSKPVKDRKENPVPIEEIADQLERELTRASSDFKKERQVTTWQDIQNKLKPGEASIEFVSFHYNDGKRLSDSLFYAAIVLTKNKTVPSMITLFEEKQLTSLINSIASKVNDLVTNKLYRDSSIYNLVWKPIEKELDGIKTVYFAPSGILHRIALSALAINKDEYLSDKYQLVQLTSTASLVSLSPAFVNAQDSVLLYGGIKYDSDSLELKQSTEAYASNFGKIKSRGIPDDISRSGSFGYLPGTEIEVRSIEKQAREIEGIKNISVLTGTNATEESFKAINGMSSPSIIHIATHGFFFHDPNEKNARALSPYEGGSVFRLSDNPLLRSGLVFAGANNAWKGKPIEGMEDGILTAYEIANMDLPNTKLVVLSACETALGDIEGNEGVYGLQRAFNLVGGQNLVMSLWRVPDDATAEYMQLFYKNLFAKQSISDAFYNAQNSMKRKYHDQPFKWGAWILVR